MKFSILIHRLMKKKWFKRIKKKVLFDKYITDGRCLTGDVIKYKQKLKKKN